MEHQESEKTWSSSTKRLNTKRWIAELDKKHALPEDIDPGEAIAAVTCVLTQRLSGNEAPAVSSGIPSGLRPFLETCVLHRDEPPSVFGLDEFLRRVGDHLDVTPYLARRISRGVFTTLRQHLSREEIQEVSSQLPTELRVLWDPDR
jgi:uncharacterized protein (DUF2267 family)